MLELTEGDRVVRLGRSLGVGTVCRLMARRGMVAVAWPSVGVVAHRLAEVSLAAPLVVDVVLRDEHPAIRARTSGRTFIHVSHRFREDEWAKAELAARRMQAAAPTLHHLASSEHWTEEGWEP